MPMIYTMSNTVEASCVEMPANELVRRIHKLQWIGMGKEAQQLKFDLSNYPAAERPSVLSDENSTD